MDKMNCNCLTQRRQGAKPFPPSDIDKKVAARTKCKNCGCVGLGCIAWRDEENHYHCATVCPDCGDEEEF